MGRAMRMSAERLRAGGSHNLRRRFFVWALAGLALIACNRTASSPPPPDAGAAVQAIQAIQAIPADRAPAFGPLLGKPLTLGQPEPGEYAVACDFEQAKYPTMEMFVKMNVTGRTRLVLRPDGTAQACFASRVFDYGSTSRYASDDGKDHKTESDNKLLLGAWGTWTRSPAGVQVSLPRTLLGRCGPEPPEPGPAMVVSLACVRVAATDVLPQTALACRIDQGLAAIEALGLDLGDSPRPGPWALQLDPAGRGPRPVDEKPARPWLVLGATPGLEIVSRDGRHDKRPQVQFKAAEVTIREQDWIVKPRSKKKAADGSRPSGR